MQQINKPYKGHFITIEGVDGSGKTALADQLVSYLNQQGFPVTRTREPGGTALSEEIRKLLLHSADSFEISAKAELLLYLAARAEHVERVIKPALLRGEIVICERFHDSTIAYQGSARHLGMHYVEELCHLVADEPDCTLFLDLDPEIGMARIQSKRHLPLDRVEQERLPFHYEVRQGYLHLADLYPERIAVIDAAQPMEEVLKSALLVLKRVIKWALQP